MSDQVSRRALAVAFIVVMASLAGGFWTGLSYSRSRSLSEYREELDGLLSEIEGLQDQVETLQNAVYDLNSTNEELREQLHKLGPSEISMEPVDLSSVATVMASFAEHYSSEPLGVSPQVPQYQLPLNTGVVSNYESFSSTIPLSDAALGLLERNGFVVIDSPFDPDEEDITQPYADLKEIGAPIFITSDSLLHLYHIQFAETLRQIEEKAFYDDIWHLSKSLLDDSIEKYDASTGDLNDASKRNVAYFAVGLSLLRPQESQVSSDEALLEDPGSFKTEDLMKYGFEVPDLVRTTVGRELELIEAHGGFSPSPIFIYEEDYSQYVPRGHYTRSERLKNYFRAMMWYGRMSLLLKGSKQIEEGTSSPIIMSEGIISEYDAKIQTAQACLIASKLAESPDLKARWDRVYAVTSFYVGLSDDLGPNEYLEALNFVFGGSFDPNDLTDEAIGLLKAKLAEYRSPQIYGGTGGIELLPPFTPEQADEILEATKGFRLMGQRFVPDSYIFQNLVPPRVTRPLGSERPFTWVMTPAGPARGFPRGLDVMAVLGSRRASELLAELKDSNYANYSVRFDLLEEEFEGLSVEDWNKNLYWSWLHAIGPLMDEFGEGYPTFMQTQAWMDKELTTALASWAELRHDTILYAKQSYTAELLGIPLEEAVVGYVEPVPEFYGRLLALTRMTREGLSEMGVIDEAAENRLIRLEETLQRLVYLSEKELRNEELSQDDYDFINDFAAKLEDVLDEVEDDAKKTTMVADVHTDQNTAQVLEEAVGYVRLIVVAYKVPDGRVLLGAGPVMSYYEFKHPMDDRLTDEAWREMLASDPPASPEWVPNFTG